MDYHKKDGLLKHLELYICKNYPLVIIGYTVVYFFDRLTETIPFMTLLTLFFMMGWTYYSHMFAHIGIPGMGIHAYHHDKELSGKWNYRLLEFFIDLFLFGGLILIPLGMGIEKVVGRMFNYYGIVFWALLYATYHLNWHFLPSPSPHHYHHEHLYCNYGPDFIDILFGTKMEEDMIEDMNSAIFNILGIFLLFIIGNQFKKRFNFHQHVNL